MVYAMFSIGILGFIVWSRTVALLYCKMGVTNLAICWKSLVLTNTLNSKNFASYTQSAGNPYTLSLKSPSETICEIFQDRKFDFFFEHWPKGRKHHCSLIAASTFPKCNGEGERGRTVITKKWLTWFIGFSEGDGAILGNQDRLKFVLTQKESAILYEIQKVLGFGVVREFKNCTRFIVTDPQEILLLFFIFNGNLTLTHRVNQLKGWVKLLNNKIDLNLSLNHNLVKPNLNDAWLSGFTDAEGCFNVAIQQRLHTVTGYRVVLKFILDQKNAELTLQQIKDLFGFGQVNLRKETKEVYRYHNNSFKGLVLVRDYFLLFPLKTKKFHSFKKWLEVYTMVLNKEHLKNEGLNKIKLLSKQINLNNSLNKKTGSAKISK